MKEKCRYFEKDRLGRTASENHKIELLYGVAPVKDKWYSVFPSVQDLMYVGVGKMLKLGAIKERPWSNRCTLVRKPGKK